MMTSRQRFLTSVGGAAATASAPRVALGQTRTLIRMAGTLSDPYGQPFFIKGSGTFAKYGFDVEASGMNNVGAVLAAMSGGALEMGVADLILGVKALLQGAPILMIAGSALYLASAPGSILAVTPNSPIRTAKDLTGKTISVPTLGALSASTLLAWLPKNGVDPSQVKMIEVPQPAVVPALERGTIDVGLLGEPFITGNKARIRDIGHPFDMIGKRFPIAVWYAAKSWIESDLPRARKVVAAIYDNARWDNAHQAETFQILVRDAHFDPEGLQGMTRSVFATDLTPAQIQPTMDFCYQYKILDRHVDATTLIAKL
jgi:NitT/TauT family transport system substrate-binding protein